MTAAPHMAEELVAQIIRPTLPTVLDAFPENGVWTVPAHVADRDMQRQVS